MKKKHILYAAFAIAWLAGIWYCKEHTDPYYSDAEIQKILNDTIINNDHSMLVPDTTTQEKK